jgi:hypothetical protein
MRSYLAGKRGDVALGIAAISLFISLGGPAWAAGLIDGSRLKPRSVSGKKIKPLAVSNSRLSSNAVTGSKIKNGSVASVDIADGSVQRTDLTPDIFGGLQSALTTGSLFTALFADDSITTAKLAANSVTGIKINPGAVSNTRLSGDAVTSVKIDDGTVASADLADGGVATADIADDAVTAGKIARNAVTGTEVDASAAPTLNFGSIGSGACDTQTVAVTGTDVSDDVIVVTPGAGFAGSTATATVQNAGQFSVTVCNLTGSAADPDGAGAVYRWVAIQG